LSSRVLIALTIFVLAQPLFAEEVEKGIPVTNELVRNACGACHTVDDANRLSRISYERKAPEGWESSVKRMIRTGQVQLTPEQAREVVRYLSDHHGLAPAEARPVFYRAEKRPVQEKIFDYEVRVTCAACHVGARFLSQRRSEEEWMLLKGMHLGYFPVAEYQGFRRAVPPWELPPFEHEAELTRPPEVAEGEPQPWRVDRVLKTLAEHLPLDTPEWRAFQAKRVERDLSGTWLFAAYEPGKGPLVGEVEIAKSGRDYTTSAKIRPPDGSIETRQGRAVLFTGYSWRGSSKGAKLGDLKEVLMLSDDGSELKGRFFKGTFGELGMDVELSRMGQDARVTAVWPRGLSTGAAETSLTVLGANLPTDIAPGDVDLGPGLEVRGVTSATTNAIELRVAVSADTAVGSRDVYVGDAGLVDGFAVYDHMDYVKVEPEEGLARLGGVRIPKQFIQFEAVGYGDGPDGERFTEDDINLGIIDASWHLEEYFVRPDDDDLKYVGEIDDEGFFTPNVEGPNPERHGTNNYGDVWAVAVVDQAGSTGPLKGRAHLVVTVPLYAYWDNFP
jgi:quinohemoprotein amine dehydrogenase